MSGPLSNQCVESSPVDAAIDAPPDSPPDAPPDADACFGGSFLTICLARAPTAPLTITSPTAIDTSSAVMCTQLASGGDYCVLAGTTIAVDSTLRATGSRPLVLIARESITVTAGGSIDVASRRAPMTTGAGAEPATVCVAGTPPTSVGAANGGGAGGSFHGKGGSGGHSGAGTGGSAAPSISAITELRGGCSGQDGAGGASIGGAGGRGGGAVYLIAGTAIDVAGAIHASGSGGGGGGGSGNGGGGGAGAGGMIGFDAPSITSTGLVLANGGGGGEGGRGTAGNAGADPTAIGTAQGGSGGAQLGGGDGGRGSAGLAAGFGTAGSNGAGTPPEGGGGGGGGGAGIIKAPATANLGANISPQPTP